jgi:hypothetical protein
MQDDKTIYIQREKITAIPEVKFLRVEIVMPLIIPEPLTITVKNAAKITRLNRRALRNPVHTLIRPRRLDGRQKS